MYVDEMMAKCNLEWALEDAKGVYAKRCVIVEEREQEPPQEWDTMEQAVWGALTRYCRYENKHTVGMLLTMLRLCAEWDELGEYEKPIKALLDEVERPK